VPLQIQPEPEEQVKEVRVQIGKDWTHHSFGRPVSRAEAAKWARRILETLA
jgi:hypothetical protein